MNYLESFKIFESQETIVNKKIQLLKDLSLELSDIGLKVIVFNGSNLHKMQYTNTELIKISSVFLNPEKYIYLYISDKKMESYDFEKIIEDFKLTLESFNMKPRGYRTGYLDIFNSNELESSQYCLFHFDKHGKMTNSDVLESITSLNKNVSENNLQDMRDILLEITDIRRLFQYKIEKYSDESCRISISNISENGEEGGNIPWLECKDCILRLIDYIKINKITITNDDYTHKPNFITIYPSTRPGERERFIDSINVDDLDQLPDDYLFFTIVISIK